MNATMYKSLILSFLFAILLLNTSAQENQDFSPFDGFNLGVTGQIELVKKVSLYPYLGEYYQPIAKNSFGWESGFELSYNFAKYFGISAGLNVGTIAAINYDVYTPYSDLTGNATYDGYISAGREEMIDLMIPLSFEFHYPVSRNFYLMFNVGAKLSRIFCSSNDAWYYGTSHVLSDANGNINMTYFEMEYAHLPYIRASLIFGGGFYYRLPYDDLLRLTVGANISFENFAEGYYYYLYHNCLGTVKIRNNYAALQLSYIHTFKKAKIKHIKEGGSVANSYKYFGVVEIQGGYYISKRMAAYFAEYEEFVPLTYGIHLINGIHFNKHLSLGMGIGYNSLPYMTTGSCMIPLYADFRYNILKSKYTPYVNAELGAAFLYYNLGYQSSTWESGMFLGIGAGLSMRLKKTSAVNFYLGYQDRLGIVATVGYQF